MSYWLGPQLPRSSGEVGGDDVGSMPVQAAAGTVVPHCGRSMSQSFLAPCSTVELGDNDPAIPTVGQVTWSPLYFPVTPLPFVALLLGGQLDRPIDVPDAAVS